MEVRRENEDMRQPAGDVHLLPPLPCPPVCWSTAHTVPASRVLTLHACSVHAAHKSAERQHDGMDKIGSQCSQILTDGQEGAVV